MYYWLHVYAPGADEPAPLLPRPDWLFTVLALMMQAVLAVRDAVGYERESREVENMWVPSRAAVGVAGGGGWRFEARRKAWKELGRVVELPARHRDGVRVGNRMWLLERLRELKQEWERFEPLLLPLAVEVERQLVVLLRQAGLEKVDDEWLDWDFEFPEYSDELVCWDAQGGYVPWTGFPPVQEASPGTPGSGQGKAQVMAAQVSRGGGDGFQSLTSALAGQGDPGSRAC